MSAHLTIRRATTEDINSLIELAAATFRDTYKLSEDPDEMEDYVTSAFTPESFSAILNDANSTLLVGLEEQRFVGYAHLNAADPPACVTGASPIEVARLYLRQDVIGKGLGAAFMGAILKVAHEGDFKTLWLVVYSRNEHARNFYRRWGFVDVGIKDFMFGGRAYPDPVMVRTV